MKMRLTPIRLRRLNIGLKSEEVIELLNISKSTFYKLEQGWITPSQKLLKSIANAYECTTDDILRDLKIKRRNNS